MSGNRAQFASNSEVPKSWEWLRSASGASPAEKEVEKANLTKQEKTHLANLMQRIANDEVLPKDVKFIKEHGLFEARLDGNHRIFRLLYVERGDRESPCSRALHRQESPPTSQHELRDCEEANS